VAEIQTRSCSVSGGLRANGHKPPLAAEALSLESPDAAVEIGREMPGVALPQHGVAPIVAGDAATADRRAAAALKLVVRRAVAHGVVDRDLIARLNALQCDDGNLPFEPRIRLAGMVDEVRRLGLRDRSEIERLLDLHRVAPDLGGQLVQLIRTDDAPAPNGNELALLDNIPSKD